jgi:glycogen debranching enzyme
MHFRNYEEDVDARLEHKYSLTIENRRCDVTTDGFPPLRMQLVGGHDAELRVAPASTEELRYRVEHDRGYTAVGTLWSAGAYEVMLPPDETCTLIASTETWDIVDALPPASAFAAENERRAALVSLAHAHADVGSVMDGGDGETVRRLLYAADQFIITPTGRAQDRARAEAAGDEVRTVIAGYHWFTDWGRDTMISLEGLTLSTGRWREAGYILRTFAYYVRDGLIPNMFPDKGTDGLYHTADASLWFFHALHRYLVVTGDPHMRAVMVPVMRNIAEWHLKGTRFGIHVDPADGLLTQGQDGYQLTWMDAKVDGWVVTPRRGKAVEINALWYNALMLLSGWLTEEGDEASAGVYADHAARTLASFNARFWNDSTQYLFDVIDGPDGDDPKCRPNQIFAISLDHPVLTQDKWLPVMERVRSDLLTPYGLRSLSPHDPEYKKTYHGDLRTRDAAYHQGTVWGWLIGPYIDAWLRVHPGDHDVARRSLDALIAHLDEYGVGSIAEVFDAEPPFTPRGCIAQAWSVAEVLRSLLRADDAAGQDAGLSAS